MTASTASGPNTSDSPGISAEAMRLLGSLTRHLHALAGLLGLEAREAIGVYVRVAVAVVGALLAVAFFYVFLLLFVAFALDQFLGVDWVWIALGFAVLHLLAAMTGLLYARNRVKTPVFRATSEEIRRDVAALRGTPPVAPASAAVTTPAPVQS